MSQRLLTGLLFAILLLMFGGMRLALYVTFQAGHPNFTEKINLTVSYAERGDWEEARRMAKDVERMWNRGHAWVHLKNPDQTYTMLQTSLQELTLAVHDRDEYETKKAGKTSILLFDSLIAVFPHGS